MLWGMINISFWRLIRIGIWRSIVVRKGMTRRSLVEIV
jgi:hypothetical protein